MNVANSLQRHMNNNINLGISPNGDNRTDQPVRTNGITEQSVCDNCGFTCVRPNCIIRTLDMDMSHLYNTYRLCMHVTKTHTRTHTLTRTHTHSHAHAHASIRSHELGTHTVHTWYICMHARTPYIYSHTLTNIPTIARGSARCVRTPKRTHTHARKHTRTHTHARTLEQCERANVRKG